LCRSIANATENLKKPLHPLTRCVKLWRSGRMIVRRAVTAVADAADRSRRVTEVRKSVTALVRPLKSHAQRGWSCT
jgi:hypothetical protein